MWIIVYLKFKHITLKVYYYIDANDLIIILIYNKYIQYIY